MFSEALTMRKMASWVYCLLSLGVYIIQIDSTAIARNYEGKCPKWQFHSPSWGCRPCHVCGHSKNYHPDCKENNDDAWCDSPQLPYPECSRNYSIHLENCTVTDIYKLRPDIYTPGCICKLRCTDESTHNIDCNLDLKWNIPSQLDMQICTSVKVSTVATLSPTSTDRVISTSVTPSSLDVLPIALGTSIGVLILGAMLVLVVLRQRRMICVSSDSSDSDNNNENLDSSKSQLLKIEEQKSSPSPDNPGDKNEPKEEMVAVQVERVESQTRDNNKENLDSSESLLLTTEEQNSSPSPVYRSDNNDCKQEMVESRRVPSVSVPVKRVESQTRETGLVNADKREPTQLKSLETPVSDIDAEKESSRKALQDLLKNFSVLKSFTTTLDQEYRYSKATWHDLAKPLVNFTVEDVANLEYSKKPVASATPDDGFTCPLLRTAHQEGLGLLDVLQCLQCLAKKNVAAEDILSTYWQQWKAGKLNCNAQAWE